MKIFFINQKYFHTSKKSISKYFSLWTFSKRKIHFGKVKSLHTFAKRLINTNTVKYTLLQFIQWSHSNHTSSVATLSYNSLATCLHAEFHIFRMHAVITQLFCSCKTVDDIHLHNSLATCLHPQSESSTKWKLKVNFLFEKAQSELPLRESSKWIVDTIVSQSFTLFKCL